jgi:hypothetical protein
MIGIHPLVRGRVGLAACRLSGTPASRRVHAHPVERAADGPVRVALQVLLVAQPEGLGAVSVEEPLPAVLLGLESPDEVVDRVKPVLGRGASLRLRIGGAPAAALKRLPHADRLPDRVAA